MIPVCLPNRIVLTLEEGAAVEMPSFRPEMRNGGTVLDTNRVFLVLEETLAGLRSAMRGQGLGEPLVLSGELFTAIPGCPVPVGEFLRGERPIPERGLTVCLVNGGGGGLGDGILFAPALRVLARRLRELTAGEVRLLVFSSLPLRTRAVLAGIPELVVRPMPMALAEYLGCDAVADLSGMLDDPAFHRSHMTDFALTRLGIDPGSVPDREKRPVLHLEGRLPAGVAAALAATRGRASGRPLVAVIFISSYTRTLPEAKAASLLRRLAGEGWQPVLLFPEGHSAPAFMERHGLAEIAVDLSPASPGFREYFRLLAGMDAIVSVDTSAVHVGGALAKPTVALFNSIDMDNRIRYSPSVHGIQLRYRGRVCQAPCGLSKARAWVSAVLADGRELRLECGYACDEAVDRQAILEEAGAAIQGIDPGGDIAGQSAAIKARMADRFHARLSPCWDACSEDEIVTALHDLSGYRHGGNTETSSEVIHVGAE